VVKKALSFRSHCTLVAKFMPLLLRRLFIGRAHANLTQISTLQQKTKILNYHILLFLCVTTHVERAWNNSSVDLVTISRITKYNTFKILSKIATPLRPRWEACADRYSSTHHTL